MYAEISDAAARQYSLKSFTADYEDAEKTATIQRVDTGEVSGSDSGSGAVVPVTLHTHAFGNITRELALPLDSGKVDWSPDLVFPGLRPNERLIRHTIVPKRAPILAKDGTPLAEGPADARTSPLGAAATAISGSVGTPKHKQEPELAKLGLPAGSPTGTSGLELAFNQRLAGQSGRRARRRPDRRQDAVGGRSRARFEQADPRQAGPYDDRPRPPAAQPSPPLASTYGGVAALDARTGEVRAVAGLAFSGAAAAGLDVQAGHDDRRAGERVTSRSATPVPDSDVHDGRRQADRQRQPRGLRRNLLRGVRRVVQQRLRRRSGPRSARRAGRHRRELRLQLARRRLYDESGAQRRRHPPRARCRTSIPRRRRPRGHGDRPGRGARDPARDGVRRPDDRQRRRARARRRS